MGVLEHDDVIKIYDVMSKRIPDVIEAKGPHVEDTLVVEDSQMLS